MSKKFSVFPLVFFFLTSYGKPSSDLITGTKPLICGLNEEPSTCVEPCLPTCEQPEAPPCTFKLCLGGCVCRDGYIRKKERGECVPVNTCVRSSDVSRNITIPQCEENEVLSDCANNCQATCARTEISGCTKLFCAHGCVCKNGYIREKQDGGCVPVEKCKR